MTAPLRPFVGEKQLHSSRSDRTVPGGGKSSGTFSAKREVLTYRQHFAIMWQRFCHENFEGPAHLAHVFKVDPTTAENWWAGTNAPQGWVIGRAITDPYLRDAAIGALSEVQ